MATSVVNRHIAYTTAFAYVFLDVSTRKGFDRICCSILQGKGGAVLDSPKLCHHVEFIRSVVVLSWGKHDSHYLLIQTDSLYSSIQWRTKTERTHLKILLQWLDENLSLSGLLNLVFLQRARTSDEFDRRTVNILLFRTVTCGHFRHFSANIYQWHMGITRIFTTTNM